MAVLIAAVAALLWLRTRFGDQLEPKQLIASLRELGGRPLAVPLFLLAFVVGSSMLMPAVGFHIVAGLVWDWWPGFLIGQLGNNLTANLHYWAGRTLGRQRVEAFLKRRGWEGAVISNSGVMTVFAVRQIPFPFVAVNFAAGVSPLKWWQFAIGSGLGVLVPTAVYVYFAVALLEGVEEARTEALLKALGAGALLTVFALGPKLWGNWRRRRGSPRGSAPVDPGGAEDQRGTPHV